MPQPRKPTNILLLNGADKKNPARLKERENEPENKNPLGTPPKELTKDEGKFWNQIKKESIDGVLGEADRAGVAMAAKLLAKVYSVDGATAAEQNLAFKMLGQFGMTPSERSKISLPGKKKRNTFDD